ncbi:Mitochondrial tRNAs modification protein [Coemansia interrupta]|uniref:N(6)-L-threonylcarbamoyladenine synthase n=1 Tax=Coemansia interrupta TaxID=1126814 RepID=A0A9W8H9L7_9FUNG|nr:Mitochondrial tRNAs modification protein [Coemansia interrupta]
MRRAGALWTPARRHLSTLRELRVLGIETSCDDTAAAVVTSSGRILGEANLHQHAVHAPHGGIVPGLAANHHLRNLPLAIRSALDQSGLLLTDLDCIAVTRGPGLPASLSVGVAGGKALAAAHSMPLVGVHHMEAHALMARMSNAHVRFPFLCLLVSGGHTMSLVAHAVNEYSVLGSTLDDSVGEAFDKVARELQLPWVDAQDGGGAGPALERIARQGDPSRFPLPVPMDKSASARLLDFSFSGLKAHVRRLRETHAFDPCVAQDQADMAAAFQHAAARHLAKKTRLAFARAGQMGVAPTCLVVSGGVASNLAVRRALEEVARENNVGMACPEPRLCTDNGVMIAWAGVERMRVGLLDPYTIDFIQRWPLDELRRMGYERRASSF